MRFLTFSPGSAQASRPGMLVGDSVLALPYQDLEDFICAGPDALAMARNLADQPLPGPVGLDGKRAVWPFAEAALGPPLSHPPSLRDFYAFEQHVTTTFANRGREVPSEWYQFPAFYFSNPTTLYGPEAAIPIPQSSQALDYELEIGCVIGIPGRDILVEHAMEHVFGFTILNDWSARDVQALERSVGLGPAKAKDFATSIGPWITTADELAGRATGRPGVYDLAMTARINGQLRSQGNWKDIHYSFAELIAQASRDVTLLPGDVLGSGTVGTGCLLELTRGQGPWLQPGDVVELEIEKLGVLKNRVAAAR